MNAHLPGSVIIAGASAAGLSAAEGLRRAGYTSRVTLVGEERHRPYNRPPLSKQVLVAGRDSSRVLLRSQEDIAGLDLDLRLHRRAVGLGTAARRVTLSDGEQIGYDALVVATRVAARRLPGTDDLAGVHVRRTLEDVLAFRNALHKRPELVIVGSGFIDAEAASVARRLGAQVTIVTDVTAPLADTLGGRTRRDTHGDTPRTRGPHRDQRAGRHGAVRVRVRHRHSVGGWPDDRGTEHPGRHRCDTEHRLAGRQRRSGEQRRGMRRHHLCRGRGVGGRRRGLSAAPPTRQSDPDRTQDQRRRAGTAGGSEHPHRAGRSPTFRPVPYIWSDQYDLKFQIYGRTQYAERVDIVEGSVAQRKLVALYSNDGQVCGAVGVNLPRVTRDYRAHVAANSPIEPLLSVWIPT